jgi:hypothetical protein
MKPSNTIGMLILGGRSAKIQTITTGKRVSQEIIVYMISIGKTIPATMVIKGNWKSRINAAIKISRIILKILREEASSRRRFLRKRLKNEDSET